MIEESIKVYKEMVKARTQDCINYQKEIERLNNIINELEKWLCQQILDTEMCEVFEAKAYNNQLVEVYKRDKRQYKLILDKLKELKEGK